MCVAGRALSLCQRESCCCMASLLYPQLNSHSHIQNLVPTCKLFYPKYAFLQRIYMSLHINFWLPFTLTISILTSQKLHANARCATVMGKSCGTLAACSPMLALALASADCLCGCTCVCTCVCIGCIQVCMCLQVSIAFALVLRLCLHLHCTCVCIGVAMAACFAVVFALGLHLCLNAWSPASFGRRL